MARTTALFLAILLFTACGLTDVACTHSRPGVYGVVVTAAGYENWAAAGLVAREGDCGVIGVRTIARLRRS